MPGAGGSEALFAAFAHTGPESRRLAPDWLSAPPSGSGARVGHETRHVPKRHAGHRSAFEPSFQTIRNHLEEDAPRIDGLSVVIASVEFPVSPATIAGIEVFEIAVPGAASGTQLNRVAAALLKGPDCSQVTLATVGRFDVPACNEPFGCHGRTKAQRAPIRGVVRNLICRIHLGAIRVQRWREGV